MRVLVVEDEKRVASAVKRGLEAEGFAVDVALTGTDGLWLAQENDYDVIVLDIMLPGVNGYRICATLREAGDWTPILMLTAKDGEYDEAEALDTGADDYLTKPFSYVVLVARLHGLCCAAPGRAETGDLRGRRPSPRSRVASGVARRHGDRADRARVLGVGVPVEPSRRSRVQARHPRTRVGFDFDGDPNIVEVYIGRLRRRVDEPFERRAIETIRGAGYRLRTDGGA